MMFLEYLIWGSWLPLLALYLGDVLGFTGAQIGWVFATQAIACVFGLYFGGQIADRLLSTEKLLAVLHLIGGAAMFALAFQTTFWSFFARHADLSAGLHADDVADQRDLFPSHRDAQTEFRQACACGARSAGSPRAGRSCSSSPARPAPICTPRSSSIFTVAGIASIALAAFSLTLPHTPPGDARSGRERADEGDRAAARSGHARAVRRDDDGCARASVLFPVDQPVPAGARASRKTGSCRR